MILIFSAIQEPSYCYTHFISQENSRTEIGNLTHWNINNFSDGKIPYDINPNRPPESTPIFPEGTTNEEIIRAIQNGFQTWENVNTSIAAFSFQNVSEQSDPAIDGTNLVTAAADPQGEGNCGTAFTRVVSCSEAGLCRLPNGKFVQVDFPGQIIDADIVLCTGNTSETISIDGSKNSDVQARITHETGHFLGFAHTGILPSTMYGYVSFDNVGIANRSRRSLSTDDVIGVSILYPNEGYLDEVGSIMGTVLDEEFNPVFGAQVAAVDFNGVVMASAITGLAETDSKNIPETFSMSSGDYVINGLPPGNYDLYADPLDGPPAGATNFGFFSVENIALNFNTTFAAHTVTVDPGAITGNVDFQVSGLNANAPNIGALTFTDASTGVIASGVAFFDAENSIRIEFGENIVSSDGNLRDATFEFSGKGVNITSDPFVSGSLIIIPISVGKDVATGPRNIIVNTPNGLSILGGGLIIADTPPLINFINPSFGGTGTAVNISGEGFLPDSMVTVDGKMATAIFINDSNNITIQIPPPFSETADNVDIEVRNDAGSSILRDAFFYTDQTTTPDPFSTPTATPEISPTPLPVPSGSLVPTPTVTPVLTPTPLPETSPSPSSTETPHPVPVITSLTVEPASAGISTRFQTATVTAIDQNGDPMQSLIIRSAASGRRAFVFPDSVPTLPNGTAQFRFRFGRLAEDAEIIFSTGGLNATITQE